MKLSLITMQGVYNYGFAYCVKQKEEKNCCHIPI